ncbi:enoyl-CoA hydratase/isomerase family protein [Xenophilus azovorans]|uniref:enoyl-CoA hydratase/isomerase family protein n=1 Tax=Xenophilus azovorans TaxID=151755 RepID=UPI00068BB49F|nr:enoyl-CoA hydratase/isomerase family protein [Xenophilus azovorans]
MDTVVAQSVASDRTGAGGHGEHDIELSIDGPIARVVIAREHDANRLTPASLARLKDIAAELSSSTSVQVLVITGEGDACFSMGLLTPELKSKMAKDEILSLIRLANETYDAIEALPQIVVAAVRGFAWAGAAELMLACDIRLAASSARFRMPEALWGGFPGVGGPVRLPQIVGYGRALELVASGREFDAEEAYRMGLLERVVPAERFDQEVGTFLNGVARSGPLALRGAKRVMRVRQEPGFRAARELSDALRHAFEWTADADEGMAAHLEHRTPRFAGR